jgi:excisionase family DNA binding protein
MVRSHATSPHSPVIRFWSASQIAAFCDVDKKTIHNWIHEGRLAASRTSGGHVRIDAMTVMLFLRTHGFPIPKELSSRKAPVTLIAKNALVRTLARKALGKRVVLFEYESALDALLAFEQVQPEALIADPETDRAYLQPLLDAVRVRKPYLCLTYFGAGEGIQGVPHATPGELARVVLENLGCTK